ncbi:OPA3-domain-containing protein [Violaceomyces palustris]|uniref:OPA3-domain-containing protein n=1 Tax=Violaceomyces palustris TaxID=1673888 RepID=A0ACD0P6X2_9BASI|nr:OPA3-domain-containing protein [Violaceomyces palustris]
MATAKIATLAIRTLAKPIATQIKRQAAEHETFRKICIALAQRMHRTEMALKTNLLPNTAGQAPKVRPLNDVKAISNGANAISEGFLFFVAATLIIGETYRSSRSRANQRDRTEEEVIELKEKFEKLVHLIGLDPQELEVAKDEGTSGGDGDRGNSSDTGAVKRENGKQEGDTTLAGEPSEGVPLDQERQHQPLAKLRQARDEKMRTERLQNAVEILLRLAIKKGWVGGDEGMRIEDLLTGREPTQQREGSYRQGGQEPQDVKQGQSSASGPHRSQSSAEYSGAASPVSIIEQVGLARARALAREVRGETGDSPSIIGVGAFSGGEANLADLLAQMGKTEEEAG